MAVWHLCVCSAHCHARHSHGVFRHAPPLSSSSLRACTGMMHPLLHSASRSRCFVFYRPANCHHGSMTIMSVCPVHAPPVLWVGAVVSDSERLGASVPRHRTSRLTHTGPCTEHNIKRLLFTLTVSLPKINCVKQNLSNQKTYNPPTRDLIRRSPPACIS